MQLRRSIILASTSIAGLALTTPAWAQEVEDIIVTAQKREESLQDVPISVTAMTQEMTQDQGLRTSTDLALTVPGLAVPKYGSAPAFFLRGVGSIGGQAGLEPAVAMFVDGVYIPNSMSADFQLANLERIEILKGPQGTLFGRNATGGAVNIITKDPSSDPGVNVEIGYGNLKTIEAKFYATGPIAEGISFGIAGYTRNQNEGWGTNQFTGEDVGKRSSQAVRGKLKFDLGEATTAILAADYARTSGDEGLIFRAHPDTSPILVGSTGNAFPFGFWDNNSNWDSRLTNKDFGGSLKIEHELSGARLTSISAYRGFRGFTAGDDDLGPLHFFEYEYTMGDDQWTQELQLSSVGSGKFQWTLGAFYMNLRSDQPGLDIFGSLVSPLGLSRITSRQKTTSIAVYGQATYEVLPQTNLTLGGRFTYDKRRFQGRTDGFLADGTVIPLIPENRARSSSSEPTWRVALDHRLSERVMIFASYNRGFKSGIFNLLAPTDPPVNPEILDAVEVGLKSDLFDRRLRLNVSGFYYWYKDLQLTKILGATQLLVNAAKAQLYGIDADMQVVVSDHLSLRGAASWLHSEYTDFKGAPCTAPNLSPPYGNTVFDCDATGNRTARSPKWTATATLDYKTPFAGGEGSANITYAYNDGFFFEASNRLKQDPYHVVNAQLMWTAPDERLSLRLWARNLFNEKYYGQGVEPFTGDFVTAEPGRSYGLSIGFSL